MINNRRVIECYGRNQLTIPGFEPTDVNERDGRNSEDVVHIVHGNGGDVSRSDSNLQGAVRVGDCGYPVARSHGEEVDVKAFHGTAVGMGCNLIELMGEFTIA